MALETEIEPVVAGRRASADAGGSRLAIDFPIKGLSFQNRIAVVSLLTAVAVLMAACLLFMLQQWRTERTHFIQNQHLLAQIVAADAAEAISRDDHEDLNIAVHMLSVHPRVISVRVVDQAGRAMDTFDRTDEQARQGRSVKDAVEVRAPILVGARKVGDVRLVSIPEKFGDLLPRFLSMGGALFFVAAGMALFMGRWLAARLARPVDRLSQAMHDVATSGDFARRVDRGEDDEFGRLTDSFNDLLAQLFRNDQELRAAMGALVEARDAAEAANVLKSQFLANMSHEIRTPLNGVLAMAQIMAMGDMSSEQRDRLGVIRQSGEALLTVLNDILDLSKIEAGRMELEDGEFDTAELCRQIEAVHHSVAAKKGLAFSVDMTAKAAGMRRGDVARLQQILNNLVANAVKFTNAGEVRITIDGEGEDGGAGLWMSVTDTGIGVPSDKLPLLFQKFTQVDASTTRRFGGTGLGLAICRELAQLMGGTVWAESLEGVGSTFFVSIPLVRVGEAAAQRPAAAAPSMPAPGDTVRILAAEDNPTNQLVLKTVMATFGLEVEVVSDGRLAVEAWTAKPYDLILMDIQMPGMDGVTATRTIREAEARTGRARTPIVALSANAMTHQVKEYLAAGMDMHVAKPIELAKLQAALEAMLGGEAEEDRAQAASLSA